MQTIAKARQGLFACALLVAVCTAVLLAGSVQPAQAYADDTQLTLAAQSSSSSGAIKPGVYYIQSQLPGELMVDVAGSSKKKGANVQLWTSNKTASQKWRFISAGKGTYKIRNVGSGKYLDVTGAVAADYTNVQQYTGNKTAAQRWKVKKVGQGYRIYSAVNAKYALDTEVVKAQNGTNVIIYHKTNATDEKWWLIPSKPEVESKQVIDDGTYEIQFAEAPSYVVDLTGASYDNGANVQIYTRNETLAQRWQIRWESDGYYSIRSVNSGRALEVGGADPAVRANVRVWANNKTDAQRWAISKNKNGSYTFISKLNGLALEVAGSKADNGTNVRTYAVTRGASQRFTLKKYSGILPEGTYNLYTMLAPSKSLVEIPEASTKAGDQAQLNTATERMEQRFYLRQVNGNVYTIQAAHSGLYLADDSGDAVQNKRAGTYKQRWTASINGNGIVFTNVSTGKRLAVSGGKATNKAKIVTAKQASKKSQRWRLIQTRLIPDGLYTVSNVYASKMLDVTGNSTLDQANVQVYTANGTSAQGWSIAFIEDGYYRFINEGSNKALNVAGNSKDAGANVQQLTYNKADGQLWLPEMRKDGSIRFTNKGSYMSLEAAGKADASNVRQNPRSSKAAQGWYLKATQATTISGNAQLDNYIRTIVKQNNGNLKSCFTWATSNIKWVDHVTTTVLPNGIIPNQTTIDYALYAFNNKVADGYYFGSLIKWLAIGCGYKAEARAGQVPAATGGLAKHGWTEVTSSGTVYVCDGDLALEIGPTVDRWFMFTYAKSPIQYTM